MALEKVLALFRHDSPVNTVTFSLDGRMLVTGGIENAMRLWDIRTNIADVNRDGSVNILELVFVATYFGGSGQHVADVNRDSTLHAF